jgi:hypothetical protein
MNHEPRPSYELEWEVEGAFASKSLRQKIVMASFVLSDASHALGVAKDRQMEAFEAYTKNTEMTSFQVATLWGVYAVMVPVEQPATHRESDHSEVIEPSEIEVAEQALRISLEGVQQVYNLKKRHLKKALRMSHKLSGTSLSA